MAYLLSSDEFQAAHRALESGDVTDELYAFIRRLVRAHVSNGLLPRALSPTGAWTDEATDELVQEWFADRLLAGSLRRAFDRSADAVGVGRYLDRSLRNWLIDRARARAEPRLLIRARRILEADDGYIVVFASTHWQDVWWGRAEWSDAEPYIGTDAALVAASYGAGDLTYVRTGADAADPVLSTVDLTQLLAALFGRARALLTLRHIDRVLRTRFAIAFVEEAAVEEDLGDRGEEDVALRALDHDASARAIAARLSGRQLALLQSRFRDGHGLVELAHEHGCAHGTVANELRRAAVMIRELIADDDDYEPVLEMLLELSVLGEEGYDAAP
jgi:hypothetical protein